MFTGIITAQARVAQVETSSQGAGKRVRVKLLADESELPGHQHQPANSALADAPTTSWMQPVRLGDSICVSGACMTVVAHDLHGFAFDISRESLDKTIGLDVLGNLLNLEQSLRLNDVLGGHLLSGHVDGTARVVEVQPLGESQRLRVAIPAALARFVAVKGSLALNGVSLTVNQVHDTQDGCLVDVNLIPHTWRHTNLHLCQTGTLLNLEIDLIARYLERLAHTPSAVPPST